LSSLFLFVAPRLERRLYSSPSGLSGGSSPFSVPGLEPGPSLLGNSSYEELDPPVKPEGDEREEGALEPEGNASKWALKPKGG